MGPSPSCVHTQTRTHTHTPTHPDRSTDRLTDRDPHTHRHRQTHNQFYKHVIHTSTYARSAAVPPSGLVPIAGGSKVPCFLAEDRGAFLYGRMRVIRQRHVALPALCTRKQVDTMERPLLTSVNVHPVLHKPKCPLPTPSFCIASPVAEVIVMTDLGQERNANKLN